MSYESGERGMVKKASLRLRTEKRVEEAGIEERMV
jgi:hypothetical protein